MTISTHYQCQLPSLSHPPAFIFSLYPFDTTFLFLFPQPLPACEAAQGVVGAQRAIDRATNVPTRVNRDACGVAAAYFRRMSQVIADEHVEMSYAEVDAEGFGDASEDAPQARPFFAGVDSQFVHLRALRSNHETLEAMFSACPAHRQYLTYPLDM